MCSHHHTPLVSVILPAYRNVEFTNQAVASVLRQTFTDYEIIVIDDASGEETISQYRFPPSVRLVLRLENSGGAPAPRNDGIRLARGRYLAFLDSDDIWLPEKLAVQTALLEAHPDVALTFCHYRFIDEKLQPDPELPPVPTVSADLVRQLLLHNIIVSPSQTLIRSSAFETVGLFNEENRGTEDWEWYLRVARCSTFLADPSVLTLYRRHANQQSQDLRRMRFAALNGLRHLHAWLAVERPDLLPTLLRQLAWRHYQLVKQLIDACEDPRIVYQHFRAAIAYDPFYFRIYRGSWLLAAHALRMKCQW